MSHVVIVFRDPVYIDPSLKGLYFLESSIEANPDIEDHQIHLGVQLQPIEVLFQDFREKDLTVRQLEVEVYQMKRKIADFYEEVKDKPYDLDPLSWLAAKILINSGFNVEKQRWFRQCCGTVKRQPSSFWCSALVAYFYASLELLQRDCSFAILTPEHFRKRHDRVMPWTLSHVLGEERRLRHV